ncbi:amino acid adenylation domain-containing protein [Clostridium aminobutyricum]|uniref:Amino acid adenylation domain-containing protein n=1 Tax=Clostridium aminobutyricum TaxID=33953 RepID=A0A939DA55_CLOAM|nr:amino acid adenylation domain-containing protein [Clostridium aminobutyricum]MBN7773930.1 amino acid adenylation domain-containing protein [Clostridium aminobutyricum]
MNNVQVIKEEIHNLKKRGIKIWTESENLKYKAFKGTINEQDMDFMRNNKLEIIAYFQSVQEEGEIVLKPEHRYLPFPQNGIQRAYSLGKSDNLKYGGVCCHTYMEIEYQHLDKERVESVFHSLIHNHPMLHTVVYADGMQETLKELPAFSVGYQEDHDFEGKVIGQVRRELEGKFYENGVWPQFDISITDLPEKSILHFSMEFLIADWTSMWLLLYQFEQMYFNQEQINRPALTFRDYVIHKEKQKSKPAYMEAKAYWEKRLADFADPPRLPVYEKDERNKKTFRRLFYTLNKASWQEIKRKAGAIGVTPTAMILSVYGYVMQRWSENKKFAINLTLLNREPVHPDIAAIIGDFTSIIMHEVDWTDFQECCFAERVKQVNRNLFSEIDHASYSGVEFLRELSKKRGGNSIYPIAFTSALGIITNSGIELNGKYVGGLTQTPQVLVDCQAMDGEFGLNINWDIREGFFKQGIIEDMFGCFTNILDKLAQRGLSVDSVLNREIPDWQLKERMSANDTKKEIKKTLLHQGFLSSLETYADRTAVADKERQLTYHETGVLVSKLITGLNKAGVRKGMKIGVAMNKSVEQIAAVLGILFVGAAYVPIDSEQGIDRIRKITESADIEFLIVDDQQNPLKQEFRCVEFSQLTDENGSALELLGDAEDTAYIIFTSGSTGMPKGVEVSHAAAMNTIIDVMDRFKVDERSSVLSVSKLNFDLSVFDLFGMLSIGGKIVLPTGKNYLQPELWDELVTSHNVSLWNSVPSLMEIYIEYLKCNNKAASRAITQIWLSGDWVKIPLIKQIREVLGEVTVISMGGATEAAIWSIYHSCSEADYARKSIPYGLPLANQRFAVLDQNLRDCPVEVPGDLYIMGSGLAKGYVGDKVITAQKFREHPQTGERMYHTGDLGKYLAGGEIEFLGRSDFQVKINGHRIELGEIEQALLVGGKVQHVIAFVHQGQIAVCVCGHPEQKNELISLAQKALPTYMVPKKFLFLEELPLTGNGKIDRKKIIAQFQEHPVNLAEQASAWSAEEEWLRVIVETVLEQKMDDKNKSFYDYGADSLSLSRAVNKILSIKGDCIAFDELLAQIMNFPTIEETARYIESTSSKYSA